MGRFFTVEFESQTITVAGTDFDIFELVPGTDCVLVIHEIRLMVSSETGDAAEEILPIKLVRGHTVSSNGAATTPALLDSKGSVAVSTAEVIGSTIASSGTPIDLLVDGFNVRTGWLYLPTPELRAKIDESDSRLVVRLPNTVLDDLTLSGTLTFEEL